MKLKHWQGYGSVNAKLVKIQSNSYDNIETLTIHVWGDHEWGLDRHQYYSDCYDWLVKKVCKKYKDIPFRWGLIDDISFKYIQDIDGHEAAEYVIKIRRG
ncbi:hypothetical protein [Methanobrevibacter sp.]|uniref:hypothetical protein n=1 Tax=Methanobrevibacter sp. TaxID=66852 RepID=UPI00388EF991